MMTGLLLLLLCQDSEYIQKLDKVKYNGAVRSCRDAERRLGSEDAYAIELLTQIINNPDVAKKECQLYIQQTDVYDPPYAFLPWQYRARARLNLAAKAKTPEEKKGLLADAVRDLEESLKRNVKSSQPLLDDAKAEIQKLSAVPSPAATIRTRQAALIAENRFKSARALVDQEGAGLTDAERTELTGQPERACRTWLAGELRRFRTRLQRIGSVSELRSMGRGEFDTAFELPAAAELAASTPELDWALKHRPTFTDVWAGRKPGTALLAAAEDAARLEENGEYPWMSICGALAYDVVRAEVERKVAECADAPAAKRATLTTEIQAAVASWTAFAGRLDADVRKRAAWVDEHARTLGGLSGKMPRDIAELDGDDLRSCFERGPVGAELQAAEERLRRLRSEGGLTLEARQKLGSLLVAARAMRLFLEGRKESEVISDVRDDLKALNLAGGAVEPDRFGPRIRRVYDSLR